MKSISNSIIKSIKNQGDGFIFTSRDFINLGTRQAVDTALSRLVTRGKIRRLARGIYDYPKQHPLFGEILPSLEEVAYAIAKDTGSHIQISGAKALHTLGLTTQVPAQVVYYADTCSKQIKIGNALLTLKHAGPKIMAGANTKAGIVLQAIRYLGKDNITDDVINKITKQLNHHDKKTLRKMLRYTPIWAKSYIDRLTSN